MRVVDHHRERLAAVHPLETSWHSRERSDSIDHGRLFAASCKSRGGRCQNVIDVHLSKKRRVNRDRSPRSNHVKTCTARRNLDRLRMEIAHGPTVREYLRTSLLID